MSVLRYFLLLVPCRSNIWLSDFLNFLSTATGSTSLEPLEILVAYQVSGSSVRPGLYSNAKLVNRFIFTLKVNSVVLLVEISEFSD